MPEFPYLTFAINAAGLLGLWTRHDAGGRNGTSGGEPAEAARRLGPGLWAAALLLLLPLGAAALVGALRLVHARAHAHHFQAASNADKVALSKKMQADVVFGFGKQHMNGGRYAYTASVCYCPTSSVYYFALCNIEAVNGSGEVKYIPSISIYGRRGCNFINAATALTATTTTALTSTVGDTEGARALQEVVSSEIEPGTVFKVVVRKTNGWSDFSGMTRLAELTGTRPEQERVVNAVVERVLAKDAVVNVFISGAPGCGKSKTAQVLAFALAQTGKNVYLIAESDPELVCLESLLIQVAEHSDKDCIVVLLFDEVETTARKLGKAKWNATIDMLERAAVVTVVLMTSNMSLDDIVKYNGLPAIADIDEMEYCFLVRGVVALFKRALVLAARLSGFAQTVDASMFRENRLHFAVRMGPGAAHVASVTG
jgi:hypothetical protein